MARKELSNFETRSRITRRTRLRIQIVVERNEMRGAKVVFTLGNHCRRIAPDSHLPIAPQFSDRCLKRCDSLSIIFEKQQRFHTL
jgi:hypothetical protein